MNELRDEVRDRYAAAAKVVATARAADDSGAEVGCCGGGCAPEDGIGVTLYDATTRAALPEEAHEQGYRRRTRDQGRDRSMRPGAGRRARARRLSVLGRSPLG